MSPTAAPKTDPSTDLANAYRYLQLVVGCLALALPVGVLAIDQFDGWRAPRTSISIYYYEQSGSFFVATLGAIAVFLLSYAYDATATSAQYHRDRLATNVGAIAAALVALVPTTETGRATNLGTYIHLGAAGLLFVILAWLAFFQFVQSGATTPSPGKTRRNGIYRASGVVIVGCIAAALVNGVADLGLLYYIEFVAVWAFGIAWLVKSERIPLPRSYQG